MTCLLLLILSVWTSNTYPSNPDVQIILDCPNGTLAYGTDFYECTATFEVPLPQIDFVLNCNYEITTDIVSLEQDTILDTMDQVIDILTDTIVIGTIDWEDEDRIYNTLAVGDYLFCYTATDECGNTDEIYCPFMVFDSQQPDITCDGQIVQIGQSGLARLFVDVFLDFVFDNCAIDRIEMRRNLYDPINEDCGNSFSLWGPHVDFYCCDIGDTVEVQLRAIDERGNINTCWVDAYIVDDSTPNCTAPNDVDIFCNELPEDIDLTDTTQLQNTFGVPTVTGSCGTFFTELPPLVNLENCGSGNLIRRFIPYNTGGNAGDTCSQQINILPYLDFIIQFPSDDLNLACSDDPILPTIINQGCGEISLHIEDEMFSASGEECFKIFRKFLVSANCTATDTIEVNIQRDEDCDGIPGDEPIFVIITPDGTLYTDRDNDITNTIPTTAENSCGNVEGFWQSQDFLPSTTIQYTQLIHIYDSEPLEFKVLTQDTFCLLEDMDCNGQANIQIEITDSCQLKYEGFLNTPEARVFLDKNNDGTIDRELDEEFIQADSLLIIQLEPEIGTHRLEVITSTYCGVDTSFSYTFFIGADCQAPPTLNCNAGVLVPDLIDEDGDSIPDQAQFLIAPLDLLPAYPVNDDECFPDSLILSINPVGISPNINDSILIITCEDVLNNNPMFIELNSWDLAGNRTSCVTYVYLNPDFQCSNTTIPSIVGRVYKENGDTLAETTVELIYAGNQLDQVETSDGQYTFNDLTTNLSYTVSPSSGDDYLNGVSTFDLIFISQHILGTNPLDSPYKMIAADVNSSQSITTLDMINIRKLLLGISLEFPGGTPSWRYIPADYVFPNPANPWEHAFPASVTISDYTGNLVVQDFIAIKMGDMNLDSE